MENEIGFLRRALVPPSRTKDRYAAGTIGSKNIMLLRTGVGPQKTTRRLSETAWERSPQCVLSIGCAGALSPDMRVGDVVIPEKIIADSQGGNPCFPSPDLVETAKDCCTKLKLPFHPATTVSTPEVVATPEKKKELAIRYDAVAVDMESAQVTAWAEENGVPALTVRTISDAADDRIPPEISGIVDTKGNLRVRKALALFASRPGLFFEVIRLKRNLDRSLKTLESIVTALLRNI